MAKTLIHRYQESIGLQVFRVKTILIFGAVLAITVIAIQNQNRLLSSELENRGRLLSDVLSNSSRLAVFSENKLIIQGLVDGAINNNSVSEIIVFNSDQKILVQRFKKSIDSKGSGENAQAEYHSIIKKITDTKSQLLIKNNDKLEIWRPVFSEQRLDSIAPVLEEGENAEILGFIKLTLDKKDLHDQLRGTIIKHVLVGFVVWLGSLIFSYKTSKNITQPIKRLTEAVKKIEIEGFGQSVPVETKNEIGRLAEAFNQMSRTLFYREKEKKRLEEQVWQNYREDVAQNFLKSIATDFESLLSIMAVYTEHALETTDKETSNHKILSELLWTNQRANDIVTRVINRNHLTGAQKQTKTAELVQNFIENLETKLPPSIKIQSRVDQTKSMPSIHDSYAFQRTMSEAASYVLTGALHNGNGSLHIEVETINVSPEDRYEGIVNEGVYDVITICTQEPVSSVKEISIHSYLKAKSLSKEDRSCILSIQKKIKNNGGEMTVLQCGDERVKRGLKFYSSAGNCEETMQ